LLFPLHQVCGLKWNSAGTQLASGGNDNRLLVWERDSTEPLYKFRDHQAAVKAIDWNPHQSGILASGGGSQDRHIRFWNTTSGTCIGATDTGSQVRKEQKVAKTWLCCPGMVYSNPSMVVVGVQSCLVQDDERIGLNPWILAESDRSMEVSSHAADRLALRTHHTCLVLGSVS